METPRTSTDVCALSMSTRSSVSPSYNDPRAVHHCKVQNFLCHLHAYYFILVYCALFSSCVKRTIFHTMIFYIHLQQITIKWNAPVSQKLSRLYLVNLRIYLEISTDLNLISFSITIILKLMWKHSNQSFRWNYPNFSATNSYF